VARLRIAEGEHPAGLDRHRGDPRVAQLFLDDQVGGGEGALRVADRSSHDDRGVVGPGCVNAVRASRGRFRRHDGRQGIVVHDDGVQRVAQAVRIVRDDDGDRLADVPHDVRGEDDLHVGLGARRAAERCRDAAGDLGQIGRGVDREDAGHGASVISRDAPEARVAVKAAHDTQVRGARAAEVVEVAAAPHEEGHVLLAARRGADGIRSRAHAPWPVR
jgi:hypothetical protein